MKQFENLVSNIPDCEYKDYLKSVYDEFQYSDGARESGIDKLQY